MKASLAPTAEFWNNSSGSSNPTVRYFHTPPQLLATCLISDEKKTGYRLDICSIGSVTEKNAVAFQYLWYQKEFLLVPDVLCICILNGCGILEVSISPHWTFEFFHQVEPVFQRNMIEGISWRKARELYAPHPERSAKWSINDTFHVFVRLNGLRIGLGIGRHGSGDGWWAREKSQAKDVINLCRVTDRENGDKGRWVSQGERELFLQRCIEERPLSNRDTHHCYVQTVVFIAFQITTVYSCCFQYSE